MIFNDPFFPHKCGQCGKTFRTGLVADWAYKLERFNKDGNGNWHDMLWFCSWKCISKYHKEHEKDDESLRKELSGQEDDVPEQL